MHYKYFMAGLLFAAALIIPAVSMATHPLITDDAGTQGKGKSQLELNGQYDSEKKSVGGVSMQATGGQVASMLS